MLFNNFVRDVMNKKEPEPVTIDFFNNPVFNTELLKSKLGSLDTVPDRELYDIVRISFDAILRDIFNKEDPTYLKVFTTPKFLTVLTQVVSTMQVTNQQRIYCNKLAYDYLTMPKEAGPDPYIVQLFLSLSRKINRENINSLLGIGINEDLACYMALARHSSENEGINVRRLNFIIYTSSIQTMTVQLILKIYEKLFDRFTTLFEHTMFDVCNVDEEWVTDDVEEMYARTGLAALYALNDMTSVDIRKVLISYTQDFIALHGGKMSSVKFSLNSISSDYSRVKDVVNRLKVEGIYVP